jgi:large subunit ribosomal protein L6
MSRIGKLPVDLPSGVTITVDDDFITVNGTKGSLKQFTMPGISVKQDDNQIIVARENDEAANRARHGLMRSLVNNMVVGVSAGFEKKLEINGVGYRVALQGTDLKFNLGFSHDVIYKLPLGIQVTVDQNIVTVSGIDKQQVGQIAAEIRALKKPEPYKGKGIKYVGERIIRKSGKSGNLAHKTKNAIRRAYRVRSRISGTAERPRMAVKISNLHITAQIIDDQTSKTLAYATTVGQKLDGTMTDKAKWVGESIAKKAKTAKVTKIVFDRSDKKYHGRIKALADAARAAGLEF